MGKAKGKSRIERKLVDKTVLPEPEPLDVWQPPDPEECEEASYPVDLVQGRDRYHVRQLMHRGRLVDFAFAQDRPDMVNLGGKLRESTALMAQCTCICSIRRGRRYSSDTSGASRTKPTLKRRGVRPGRRHHRAGLGGAREEVGQ